MSTTDFDTLLSSLSSSVSEAQRSLSTHHQGRLKRLYTDDIGTNLTWTFYIPSEEDDNHYRPIELPLVSLRSPRELNISELSIEMTKHLHLQGSMRFLLSMEESERALELLGTTQSSIKKARLITRFKQSLPWLSGLAAILYTTSLLK